MKEDLTPIMIYDGDCNFCCIWIDYWKQLTGDTVAYRPYQEVEDQYPQISREQFRSSVQLVKRDGTVIDGAHAVFQSLAYNSRKRWMLRMYEKVPGVSLVTELCYRFIARHRNAAFKITVMLRGKRISGDKEHNIL